MWKICEKTRRNHLTYRVESKKLKLAVDLLCPWNSLCSSVFSSLFYCLITLHIRFKFSQFLHWSRRLKLWSMLYVLLASCMTELPLDKSRIQFLTSHSSSVLYYVSLDDQQSAIAEQSSMFSRNLFRPKVKCGLRRESVLT